MKKIFIILLCCVSLMLNASTYYVATNGNNSYTKTQAQNISTPWLTWQYAESQVVAGDSILIRGGTYYQKTTYWYVTGVSGTAENPIVVMNYNDEVPILNGDSLNHLSLVWVSNVDYWHFIGLNFTKAMQDGSTDDMKGFLMSNSDNCRVERCTSYDNEGPGFFFNTCDNLSVINCDAYNNCNILASAPSKPGGAAEGFTHIGSLTETDTTKWVHGYFYGCRAWNCSDNGFGIAYGVTATIDSCWAWDLGWQLYNPASPDANGDGRGFPCGLGTPAPPPNGQIIVKHCISANNKGHGYHLNCNGSVYTGSVYWYNNISINNREYGFVANFKTNIYLNIYRNNLAYDFGTKIAWGNGDAEFSMEPGFTYTSDHNSWDATGVNLSDVDFVAIDTTALSGARQADGSLPVITFYNLASTSELIDAGVDVGLDYNNAAPDIGWSEYETFSEASAPYINTNEPIITRSREVVAGGNLIDAGGGSILAKGVVYSQEINPTTSDSIIVVGTGTDDFTVRVPNLTKSTTYHVRAYATNETGTAYGADVEFTTPASSPVQTGGKLLQHGNYYIKIE